MSSGIQIVGFFGGSFISCSLIPQVYKTWKTKSAGDISYGYQSVYIVGCTLVNTYALSEGLWPVFIPALLEQTLIIILTMMKIIYDKQESTRGKILDNKYSEREIVFSKDAWVCSLMDDSERAESTKPSSCTDVETGSGLFRKDWYNNLFSSGDHPNLIQTVPPTVIEEEDTTKIDHERKPRLLQIPERTLGFQVRDQQELRECPGDKKLIRDIKTLVETGDVSMLEESAGLSVTQERNETARALMKEIERQRFELERQQLAIEQQKLRADRQRFAMEQQQFEIQQLRAQLQKDAGVMGERGVRPNVDLNSLGNHKPGELDRVSFEIDQLQSQMRRANTSIAHQPYAGFSDTVEKFRMDCGAPENNEL